MATLSATVATLQADLSAAKSELASSDSDLSALIGGLNDRVTALESQPTVDQQMLQKQLSVEPGTEASLLTIPGFGTLTASADVASPGQYTWREVFGVVGSPSLEGAA